MKRTPKPKRTRTRTQRTPEQRAKLLKGAEEIAEYIGDTVPKTRWLLWRGGLPAFRRGGMWHMRPAAYDRACEELEAAARTTAEARAKARQEAAA